MIRSAVLRLTLSYLTIIMVLSICFSFALYRISSGAVNRSLRQPSRYDSFQTDDFLNFNAFRDTRLVEAHKRLEQNLLLLNLGALVVGSLASYFLAKRTLQPIEESLDAQSRFTADASHELRTPLTVMQTEIEVALRDKKMSAKDATDLLQSNLEEVIKLRALSDALLKLARQDKTDLNFKNVSLRSVADTAVKQLQPLARTKKVTIDNQVQKSMVRGDSQSLVELSVILMDNAIKYTHPQTTVTLSSQKHGSHVSLTVKDEGPGINASDMPYLFDRFYRADSSRSKDKTNGHGLGLSIAKKIAELHGGVIEARSAPGHGATFTVILPLHKSS